MPGITRASANANDLANNDNMMEIGIALNQFVPELKDLPIKYLFSPWLASEDLLSKINIKLGVDYPRQIIDHNIARQRALEAYDEVKISREINVS